jgi:GntR family transcriptional regulator
VTKQSDARERVLDMIEALEVGDAIPSERQLTVDLGVSRLTVRAALDDLVREGYLVRRRGMSPASKTIDLRIIPAGAWLGRVLHVSPSEGVVVVKRLRLADRETMAIETLHVRESLVPGLSAQDLEEGSFYELLRERYGIEIVGGIQTIEPTVTNEEESGALGVPLHSPAFLFERVTRSGQDEIVEFVRSIYRGDRYRLVTELSGDGPGRARTALARRDGFAS